MEYECLIFKNIEALEKRLWASAVVVKAFWEPKTLLYSLFCYTSISSYDWSNIDLERGGGVSEASREDGLYGVGSGEIAWFQSFQFKQEDIVRMIKEQKNISKG